MSATIGDIITRARHLLADTGPGSYRWSDAEMLLWANDGIREIVTVKPDSNYVVETVALEPGVLQALPDEAVALIDILCNISGDDSTPGATVTQVSQQRLDAVCPEWRSMDPNDVIEHYIRNPSMPRHWMAYPPAVGGAQVEMVYSVFPDPVSDVGDAFPLADGYINPMVSYLLYRALSKDVDYSQAAGGATRAAGELVNMYTALGRMDLVEMVAGRGRQQGAPAAETGER